MNVRWAESALDDLRAIETSIARHSDQYARVMVGRIFSRCERLENLPRLGPVVPELHDESLRELFEDPDRIIDRVEDEITILAIVHAARRLPRAL